MDMIKLLLQHPRRFIPDYFKVSIKTRKRKIRIIQNFLLYLQKDLGIKNFKEIKKEHLEKYIEIIKTRGSWNKKLKRFEKISEATLKDHIAVLKQFLQKISLKSRA